MTVVADASAGSSPTDTDPLLRIEDLYTWYDTPRGVVRAVDGVSLRLDRGRTIGVVGESGSGKSVLARSVMNLLPSRALTPRGQVWFRGEGMRAMGRRELRPMWGAELSMVFQDPLTSLNPVMRIQSQLTEGMREHLDLKPAEARERAVQLLVQVGIPEPERRLRMYPHELSGGMRQRVGIAVALACRPSLLIADEPTTALDVTIQRQILDLLDDIRRSDGMAMILITHNLGVAAGRTDEIAVMYGGRVVEHGPTAQVFATPRHPYTTALLSSLPRMDDEPHSRLTITPGRPPVIIDPPKGCRFAPRCARAQARCLEDDPALWTEPTSGNEVACFFPVGTSEGDAALQANKSVGTTATGRTLDPEEI